MKLLALSVVLLLTITLVAAQTPAQSVKPKLILVLALDQLKYDHLTHFRDLFTGGFRKLLDSGAVFTNAYYRHAITETGPGHSVILSGRHPSSSGIIGNVWWDSLLRVRLNVVDDPVHVSVGGEGRGASPANFIGFTLGDILKAKSPESRVVATSAKDRSAVLMGGRRADAAYWFEGDGNFITSSYYMLKAPEWLTKWNTERMANSWAGKSWTRLLPDTTIYEKYAGRDNMPGEADGKDNVFPHVIPGTPPARNYYAALRNTPFMDEVTLAFTVQAMRAHSLGQDAATDILAIGFSSSDTIGHRYGSESHETMDQLLRLDQTLNQLFQHIDKAVGLDNTLVAVTADHGSMPLIEALKERGVEAQRGTRATVDTTLRQALAAAFPGIQGLIADLAIDSQVDLYFDEDVVRKNNLGMRQVEETAAKAILATGFFDIGYTKSQLMDDKTAADPYLQLFRNSFFASRSPNVTFMPKKYVSFALFGSSHGTAHDYDRHVPIIFMGPGIKPGSYAEASGPEDIAPTLAKILGLAFPKEFDSRILTEMLQ